MIALFHLLTDRNFILITGIKEFQRIDDEFNVVKGRKIRTIRRTDYGGESDFLSCLAGAKQCDSSMVVDVSEYSTELPSDQKNNSKPISPPSQIINEN
jgi:hypothetical protein